MLGEVSRSSTHSREEWEKEDFGLERVVCTVKREYWLAIGGVHESKKWRKEEASPAATSRSSREKRKNMEHNTWKRSVEVAKEEESSKGHAKLHFPAAAAAETKVVCNKTIEIGKATLTCIRLQKTTSGWILSDEQTQTRDKDELSDSENDQVSFSPKSEFEKFVIKKFKMSYEKTDKMKKSVKPMERKTEEIIKNYVESSTSIEELDEIDESNEEDSMEMSDSE
ncbi:hypothetical protein LR48_Vigan176s000700 [Vigna angularis]|uniref:Uncharacterized protein n=1 Tax=Phaseolus angularis TaxID=3914 RepID=A0A0L9T5S8_PHAAN|nr:hypothetical protein LR48_Vigan176s000700 [Vigna angularis]